MLVFGDTVEIQRYDNPVFPKYIKWDDRANNLFWRESVIDLSKDKHDFKKLASELKHIFVSNISRQVVLDSKQGMEPLLCFGPIASQPEIQTALTTWTFFENIHSRSYTHILRAIYDNPTPVMDSIMTNEEILKCHKDIGQYYEELDSYNRNHIQGTAYSNEHKLAYLKALVAVNALEGIRFFVSFACSFAMAENAVMEGNAKIIKLIAKDEQEHLKLTQLMLADSIKTDPDMRVLFELNYHDLVDIYNDVVEQEKEWANYLFKDGSMLGLNAAMCHEYIDYLANIRMSAVGLAKRDVSINNPLPWMDNWLDSSRTQNALQETENESYLMNIIDKDVNLNELKEEFGF